ncbi:MAG: cytidylate kinase, partial [Actinobacteria bacterium]|nr:cytidylate kinase [Actinomycetota bacterium]
MTIVVAMDGPSGSGKSSTSRGLAKRAGWNYLDTGALYRAATWLALEKNCNDASALIVELKNNEITFQSDPHNPVVACGGRDISLEIRTQKITEEVSRISAWP